MGDAGSLFLGFTVGGLSLVATAGTPAGSPAALLLPGLIVMVPIFDSAFVTVHRFAAGRPISQGGRDHASHRLVAAGFSERQAVVALYAAGAVSALVALATARYGLGDTGIAIALLGVGVVLFGVFLGRVGGDAAPRPTPPRPAPARGVVLRPAGRRLRHRRAARGARLLHRVPAALRADLRAEEPLFVASLPLVVAAKMVAFAMLRTYQGLWRHTSLADLVRLAQAVVLGGVFAVLGVLAAFRFHNYSRALFVVDGVLLFLFLGGSRVAARLMAEGLRPGRPAAGRSSSTAPARPA